MNASNLYSNESTLVFDVTTEASMFDPIQANFSLAVATTSCRTWNEEDHIWMSNGCQVSDFILFLIFNDTKEK